MNGYRSEGVDSFEAAPPRPPCDRRPSTPPDVVGSRGLMTAKFSRLMRRIKADPDGRLTQDERDLLDLIVKAFKTHPGVPVEAVRPSPFQSESEV